MNSIIDKNFASLFFWQEIHMSKDVVLFIMLIYSSLTQLEFIIQMGSILSPYGTKLRRSSIGKEWTNGSLLHPLYKRIDQLVPFKQHSVLKHEQNYWQKLYFLVHSTENPSVSNAVGHLNCLRVPTPPPLHSNFNLGLQQLIKHVWLSRWFLFGPIWY